MASALSALSSLPLFSRSLSLPLPPPARDPWSHAVSPVCQVEGEEGAATTRPTTMSWSDDSQRSEGSEAEGRGRTLRGEVGQVKGGVGGGDGSVGGSETDGGGREGGERREGGGVRKPIIMMTR
eukprot:2884822-Rhodomonas_salina.1